MMAIIDSFGLATLTAELTKDEGRRHSLYSDSKGYWTIGVGRNLSSKGLNEDEIDFLLDSDISECCTDLDIHLPWWRKLPAAKQRTMLNLTFNLGWPSFSKFVHFLAAMQAHHWKEAAVELENSAWFKQVGSRGPRVVERLLADPPEAVA